MARICAKWSIQRMVASALCCLAAACVGCGMITDKDRIKVAKLRDEYVTRGDLFRLLRDMPDDQRPQIRTRGDLLRVLRILIDNRIKVDLGRKVEAEIGKELVSRQQAMQRFFAMYPDENYQFLFSTASPDAFDMTQAQWESAKQEAELQIDKILDQLRGDAAVTYEAMKALKEGSLTLTDDDYKTEYDVRKEELKAPEAIHFLAIRFVASDPEAAAQAADVRRRVDAGEKFDAIADEYLAKDKSYILNSDIRNVPGTQQYGSFWITASGCHRGDIIGPVFLPAYELVAQNEKGEARTVQMPAAYLIFKVLEHVSERSLSIDEARVQLASGILFNKMMERLRAENGVEIYRDKLPDPAMLERTIGDPITGAE